MKRVVLGLALVAFGPMVGNAMLSSYSFQGIIDHLDDGVPKQYSTISGSFDYDDTAAIISEGQFAVVQDNALSNFTLRLDQDVWSRQQPWYAEMQKDNGDLTIQDALLDSDDNEQVSFFWGPQDFAVRYADSRGYMGRITSFARSNNFSDAAPAPEPSSLALLGSGLLAFGAWRRRVR